MELKLVENRRISTKKTETRLLPRITVGFTLI